MRFPLAVLALLALGCSMSPSEKLYIGGGLADLGTTAYGLESCANAREANPALTVAGDDTASVLVTAALFKWAVWALLHKDGESFGPGLAISGAVNMAVAGHNAAIVNGCTR